MPKQTIFSYSLHKGVIVIVLILVFFGILNIFSAVSEEATLHHFFSLELNSGKQLLRLGIALILSILLFFLVPSSRFFFNNAYLFYFFSLLLLVLVLFFGRNISGATSWFVIGNIRFQPSEFAKVATALAIARFIGEHRQRDMGNIIDVIKVFIIIFTPMTLIVLQGDTGSALIFLSMFIVFYREGLSYRLTFILLTSVILFLSTIFFPQDYFYYILVFIIVMGGGIYFFFRKTKRIFSFVFFFVSIMLFVLFTTQYVFTQILKPHQQKRIEILMKPHLDPLGMGWQVNQSKIAIGSGGFYGKGYFKGTQTNFQFIPDQSTDFIFCTIGEEFGFIGSCAVLGLFILLFYYIINLAEKQSNRFARVYGYSVFSILFFHFFINMGMTMGIVPVIGIPLPFLSFGGSSLISMVLLITIFLKIHAHRHDFF